MDQDKMLSEHTMRGIKMKKIRKIFILLALFCCCIAVKQNYVYAAKAKKVTHKRYTKNGKEYMIVKGKTSKGKVCWTYKTPKYSRAELTYFGCKINKTKVYVFERYRVTVLKLSNGKKSWRKKTKCVGAPVYTFDSKSNLYLVSNADSRVEKFTKTGKKKWKRDFSKTKNYMPRKMKYKKNQLTIYCAGDDSRGDTIDSWVKINATNGKILGYKNK